MKLLRKNLLELSKQSDNALVKNVCYWVASNWQDFDDKTEIFTQVLRYGCESGTVSELMYYSQTTKYYEKFKTEINDLLNETMQELGVTSPVEVFRDKWDIDDPLVQEDSNKNLLAWFGFEETLRSIAGNFEELENKI